MERTKERGKDRGRDHSLVPRLVVSSVGFGITPPPRFPAETRGQGRGSYSGRACPLHFQCAWRCLRVSGCSSPRPVLLRTGPPSPTPHRLPPRCLVEEGHVLFEEDALARWGLLPQMLGDERFLARALLELQRRPTGVSQLLRPKRAGQRRVRVRHSRPPPQTVAVSCGAAAARVGRGEV
ncbi:hypothetical protein HJG60_010530 [Phyllostomus discolor]|uniref:Uncharacterized protein n=1 Tax=Phyllostomus discolor TaxID=89673 RepID=A0A834ARG9_9CHIR|nr:hypothetical protein HJG60_010530 [Phyllostomus discolor]